MIGIQAVRRLRGLPFLPRSRKPGAEAEAWTDAANDGTMRIEKTDRSPGSRMRWPGLSHEGRRWRNLEFVVVVLLLLILISVIGIDVRLKRKNINDERIIERLDMISEQLRKQREPDIEH